MNLYNLFKNKIDGFVEKNNSELIEKAFELRKQATLNLATKTNLPENVLEQFVKSTINPEFYLKIAYIQQPLHKKIKYDFVSFLENSILVKRKN